MSTETTLSISTKSLEDTYSLGAKIARNLRGGEVIELVSDVGGGKTAIVRGMAQGIDSSDNVASPTFTISRIYKSADKRLSIAHYDFYRLDDAGIMSAEIEESINDTNTTVVIEWAGLVNGVLPQDRLKVEIEVGESENDRQFIFKAGPLHKHLLENLV